MQPHQPTRPETPPETVVEFGPGTAAEPDGRPRRRLLPGDLGALAGSLVRDRRLVPLAAIVAAVALFGSLVSEWQVTTFDVGRFQEGGTAGDEAVPASVADLGGFGAGYVTGLLVLAIAVVLCLFGGGPVRTYARLVGLTTGGVLLAVLVAVYAVLGETTRSVDRLLVLLGEDPELAYGRGLWCAFFGVAAAMVALYLAERHLPEGAAPVWSWRRPRTPGDDEEAGPEAPFDLSVTSTKPFTSLSDDRDKPLGRD